MVTVLFLWQQAETRLGGLPLAAGIIRIVVIEGAPSDLCTHWLGFSRSQHSDAPCQVVSGDCAVVEGVL